MAASAEEPQWSQPGDEITFGGEFVKTPQAGEFRLAQAVFQIITQVAQRPFFVRAIAPPLDARDVGDGGFSRFPSRIQSLDMC
ncbi:MAG: hypothetical protein ABW292_11465, partial [Vicinamibacterales bacterium]